MTYNLLSALAAFAFVSSITPGPNNLMLMASGANFGFRRTIPHMLGIAIGFTVMVVLVGVGLSQVFETWPVAHTVLKGAALLYMSWLAWKIATAAPPEAQAEANGQPLTFLQAALFQWVNPKAWVMAVSALSLYGSGSESIAVIALVFGGINLPSVAVWMLAGHHLRPWLNQGNALRNVNRVMAILLVASFLPLL